MKCASCGLANFAGVAACRRCGAAVGSSGAAQPGAEPMVTCGSCFLARPASVEGCPFCSGGKSPSPGGFGPDADADGQGQKPWRGHLSLALGGIVIVLALGARWLMSMGGAQPPDRLYIFVVVGGGLLFRGIRGQEPPGWS